MAKKQTQTAAPEPVPKEALPVEYSVRIYPARNSKYTLATANVDINGVFAIRGVQIIRGENGPFVGMPQYKDSHGDYHDICFPCTAEARQQFNKTVLDTYEQELGQSQQQGSAAMDQLM